MPYPDGLRTQIEEYLEELRFSDEPLTARLVESMRYSLLAGGKRIRPVLALATARAIGRDERELLPLAAAIELIHTYSLIHDDLPAMDDDALRRGRPTNHIAFGEDTAILAGDALYAEAFRLVLTQQRGEPAHILAAVGELAAATGVDGMVGGQYLDVASVAAGHPDPAHALRRTHELKTGRLIGASVECVLLIAGMSPETTTDFRNFAAELGVLFQIVDDILDVTGTDAALGKPSGSDERHGKRTYVTEFGLDGARELAARSHAEARASLAAAAPQGAPELEQITDFIAHARVMSLLDHIDRPQDLHALSEDELRRVAQEVREHIIDTVGEIGGHFGANLGTCELAVALHSLLDSPRDKILWDVGHQAYPHKILTGRRDQLATIRKYGGLAPFCSIGESEHDIMGAGHASTSIGYAVGLKEGMKHLGRDEQGKVVAVIGDGSMTGGVAFEAIHQAGGQGTPIVVVLNDNGMSIAPNVGAMSRYFNRVRLNPKLWHTRESVEERLTELPGRSARRSSASARRSRSRSRRSGRPACSGRSSTGRTSASSTATTSARCAAR